MAVRIVTDSTSDIPRALADQLRITVIPLTVSFGDESYRDGIDLTADEFYAKLRTTKTLPATSQPPPALFQHAYSHVASYSDVVSVHLSHKFSGTVETARNVAQQVAPSKITVVDSGSASMGTGLCVLAAARLAARGASRDECVAAALSASKRLHVTVAFETLDYLRRGGRIGRAQAFVGGVLRLKPILTVRDGEAFPVTRVRSRAKALDELFALCARVHGVSDAVIMHTTTPEDAGALVSRVRAALPDAALQLGRFGPVLGVHGGPGMIGIALLGRDEAQPQDRRPRPVLFRPRRRSQPCLKPAASRCL